jgi:hypothetical protein
MPVFIWKVPDLNLSQEIGVLIKILCFPQFVQEQLKYEYFLKTGILRRIVDPTSTGTTVPCWTNLLGRVCMNIVQENRTSHSYLMISRVSLCCWSAKEHLLPAPFLKILN